MHVHELLRLRVVVWRKLANLSLLSTLERMTVIVVWLRVRVYRFSARFSVGWSRREWSRPISPNTGVRTRVCPASRYKSIRRPRVPGIKGRRYSFGYIRRGLNQPLSNSLRAIFTARYAKLSASWFAQKATGCRIIRRCFFVQRYLDGFIYRPIDALVHVDCTVRVKKTVIYPWGIVAFEDADRTAREDFSTIIK